MRAAGWVCFVTWHPEKGTPETPKLLADPELEEARRAEQPCQPIVRSGNWLYIFKKKKKTGPAPESSLGLAGCSRLPTLIGCLSTARPAALPGFGSECGCGLGLGSWAWQGVPPSLGNRTALCPLELCSPGAELCSQKEGAGHPRQADRCAWPP